MELRSFAGDWIVSSETIEVRSPANKNEIIGHMPICSDEHLNQVVEQALPAQDNWSKKSITYRIDCIQNSIGNIENNSNELLKILKKEQGMLESVINREIQESINQIKHTLRVAPDELDSLRHEDANFQATVRKVPYGIVGAIVPWNAPISLATAKVIPALLAGNAVIIKPSPRAPIGVTYFLELLRQSLPLGLICVLHGLELLGEAIIDHPMIKKISFTGSTEVGRKVAQSAARNLKSVHLELGGNDAAIVCPDADIDSTASNIIESAFRRSGQFCYATKRVYVHSSIEQKFSQALQKCADKLKIGPPSDQTATVGPVIDKFAQTRLEKLISEARQAGAAIKACGAILDSVDLANGCYVRPTLVWNVDRLHPIVIEEQFGPILPVLPYNDLPQLIQELNGQKYGLSGSIWGSDLHKLNAIAQSIHVGRVFINAARAMGAFSGQIPAGGHRQSGLGWEKSVFGLREYYQYQTVNGPVI